MDESQEENNSDNLDWVKESFAAAETDVAKIPDVSAVSEDSILDGIEEKLAVVADVAEIFNTENEVVADELEDDDN